MAARPMANVTARCKLIGVHGYARSTMHGFSGSQTWVIDLERWGGACMKRHAGTAVAEICDQGFAKVVLESTERIVLAAAFDAGGEFFARPREAKARHISVDLNHGFRPLGKEYSVSADRPDLNECFVVWGDRIDLIPAAEDLGNLLEAWSAYRTMLGELVESVVGGLAERFGGGRAPDFRSASYLQMNGYTDPNIRRDLLQDLHEDGHMITVHYANAPGLEVRLDGEIRPFACDPGTLVLMPGSVLTDLTSGGVDPLYHQVRNHRISGRSALMYFVNPNLDLPVHPWNDVNGASVDLRERIRTNPSAFGLVDVPVL